MCLSAGVSVCCALRIFKSTQKLERNKTKQSRPFQSHCFLHTLPRQQMQHGQLCFFGDQHECLQAIATVCCVTVHAHTVTTWALPTVPTLVASSVLDDDGASAARLLFCLGHALASFVVRVIGGIDSHLLLNHSEAWQLLGSTEMKRKPSGNSFHVIIHENDLKLVTLWTFIRSLLFQ